MGIRGVGHGQSVLQHIDIGRGQTDLNLARAVGTCCVEHHVAVAFLFLIRGFVVLGLSCEQAGTEHERQSYQGFGIERSFFHFV